jgi:hypothetical protein
MRNTVSSDEVIPIQVLANRRLGDCSGKEICGLEDGECDEDIEELDVDELDLVRASHACEHYVKGAVEIKMDALIDSFDDLFEIEGWELEHIRVDRYKINGRKVRIFLLPAGTPIPEYGHNTRKYDYEVAQKCSMVMVHDGPLRQPLLDYMAQSGKNEHYDARGTENPVAVSGHAKRLEYSVDQAALGDRIHAMKAATAQATARRKVTATERDIYSTPIALDGAGSLRTPSLFGHRVS